MKFVQWVSGDRIDLEAYDGYWGEKLPFETATARIIVESSSRSIELDKAVWISQWNWHFLTGIG